MQTLTVPYNAVTRKFYQGKNMAALMEACEDNGWESGAFATFRQWLKVGRCVMKGEPGTKCIFFAEKPEDASNSKRRHPCRPFFAHAFEQTVPLDEYEPDDEKGQQEQMIAPALPDEEAPMIEPVTHEARPTQAQRDAALDRAATLSTRADACFAPRLENTPRRIGQAANQRTKGAELERCAIMLSGWADDPESTLPVPTFRDLCQAAARLMDPVCNGYHSYMVETDKWVDDLEPCATLRQYLEKRAPGVDRIKEQEKAARLNALRMSPPEGFFPTPDSLTDRMLDIIDNHFSTGIMSKGILEPSAGMGSMVAKIKERGADAWAVEVNYGLANIITEEGKAWGVIHEDFLALVPRDNGLLPEQLDAVCMNPPFENKQAIDHVRHAFGFLAPGGILAAVVPSIFETYADSKPTSRKVAAFAEWLAGKSYHFEAVEAGIFAGADSFRQTGVNVSLLIITA